MTNKKVPILPVDSKFTIIEKAESGKFPSGKTYGRWKCRCVCGKEVIVKAQSLKNGDAKSCGCFHDKWGLKHGACANNSETRSHRIWRCMKERCYNPNHVGYKNYGGKGIIVCARWLNSFTNFLEDMGEAPDGLTLDRYPNKKGNYEPGNCRWATPKQQQRNTESNRIFTIDGVSHCLSEWCEIYGMDYQIACKRVASDWPILKILTQNIARKAVK